MYLYNRKDNLVIGVKTIKQEISYNVAIGGAHIMASYGGLIDGYNSTVSGAYASVTGESHNTASVFSVVPRVV